MFDRILCYRWISKLLLLTISNNNMEAQTYKGVTLQTMKWGPINTAWHVLRLRMKERPPVWRVAANIL